VFTFSGFGYSGGVLYNCLMEEFHEDLHLIISKSPKNIPLFIFGHSTGSLILTTFLLNNNHLNIAGVICSSSFFVLPNNINPIKAKIIAEVSFVLPVILFVSFV